MKFTHSLASLATAVIVAALAGTSCVSNGKYKTLMADYNALQTRYNDAQTQLNDATGRAKTLDQLLTEAR